MTEAENQERQTNALIAEKEKKEQEAKNLRQQIERINARIDSLHDEHGSDLEIEPEINRLNQLKKNYQKDLDSVNSEKRLEKKQQSKANADRERAKLEQMVKERNEMEERLNNTKPLDELKERVNELNRQTKKTRQSFKMKTPRPQKEKPQKKEWQKESRSAIGCKFRLVKEKVQCP